MRTDGIAVAMRRIDEIQKRIQALVGRSQPPAGSFAEALEQVTAPADRPASSSTAPENLRPLIEQAAAKYGLPPQLVEAVARRESAFNPRAVSPRGAQGLMQIMPSTQNLLGVTEPFDEGQSLDGGSRYLRMMLDRFGGDTRKALAAYNAGPEAVERYNGIPPYAETRNYVSRILSDLGTLDGE